MLHAGLAYTGALGQHYLAVSPTVLVFISRGCILERENHPGLNFGEVTVAELRRSWRCSIADIDKITQRYFPADPAGRIKFPSEEGSESELSPNQLRLVRLQRSLLKELALTL